MKKIIWTMGALIVVGGAVIAARAVKSPAATGTASDATTTQVARGDVLLGVSSTGKVVSSLDIDIKCRASGEVIKLPYDVSDQVHKGDLLLELDASDAQRDERKAQAAVAQSRARLAEAQKNEALAEQDVTTSRMRATAAVHSAQTKASAAEAKVKRREQLIAEKLGSAEDLELSQSDAATARAELETAEAQLAEVKDKEIAVEVQKHEEELAQAQLDADLISLENAKQQVDYCKVVAPVDAVVSARSVQIGTIVASGITNVGGGTTVVTLSDISRIFVLVSVDEADIGQVRVGQQAQITVDSFSHEKFEGKVLRIATTGVSTSNVVTFEVKVEVTSANKSLLKPTMTANVQIIRDQRQNVLTVPEQAVTRANGAALVSVLSQDKTSPTSRPVTLGLSDGDNVEVISGVKEGESVVVRKEAISRWTQSNSGPPGPPQ